MTFTPNPNNIIDSNNTNKSTDISFNGVYTEVSKYSSLVIVSLIEADASFNIIFSNDGTTNTITKKITIYANKQSLEEIPIYDKYYKIAATFSSSTNYEITSFLKVTNNQIVGTRDNGTSKNINISQEGFISTSIMEPSLPFGAIHTENLYPVFQVDAIYGINVLNVNDSNILNGGIITTDYSKNTFTCYTSSDLSRSFASLQSRKMNKYRPGQGLLFRFTGLFGTPANNCQQFIGASNYEDGLYFGYNSTQFGIMYMNRGLKEIKLLTINGFNTVGDNTLTLNNITYSFGTATSISDLTRKIFISDISGWSKDISGNSIILISKDISGTITYNGSYNTNFSANLTDIKNSQEAIEMFIPQSQWNGDKLDGYGPSGYTADWQKGNVFQIELQYLGFGCLTFKVETTAPNSNYRRWTTVHNILLPNTLTGSSFKIPSFPFTMVAKNPTNSPTQVSVDCASFAGFIEGNKSLNNCHFSYLREMPSPLTANSINVVFTIYNTNYYNNVINQSVVNITSLYGSYSTPNNGEGLVVYLIKNGEITGSTNFYKLHNNSCTMYDQSASLVTYTSIKSQLLWTGHINSNGGKIEVSFNNDQEEFILQPGEWMTIGCRIVKGGTTHDGLALSLNISEDH